MRSEVQWRARAPDCDHRVSRRSAPQPEAASVQTEAARAPMRTSLPAVEISITAVTLYSGFRVACLALNLDGHLVSTTEARNSFLSPIDPSAITSTPSAKVSGRAD